MLFLLTGVGDLGRGPLGHPVVFLGCLAVLAGLFALLSRYYNDTHGRVRLATGQQVRFTLISFACFGIPMVAGSILDYRLDVPVSIFATLLGLRDAPGSQCASVCGPTWCWCGRRSSSSA